VTPQDAWNPKPDDMDYVLPLPCDLSMAFRPVFVTKKGILGETKGDFGSELQSANDQTENFSKRHTVFVGAPLSIPDLPESYRPVAEAAKAQASLEPEVRQLIMVQKYETSVAQYDAVMKEGCQFDPKTAALPVTNVTWYDAQSFTERLMTWVIANRPETLPKMADEPRIIGMVRLPTEDEWEYAARGGHRVEEGTLSNEDIFPMDPGESMDIYGTYLVSNAPPPTAPSRIGRKKANPAGIHDTVGNVSEMTLDAFKITVGSRLHGSAGGFVKKGGSFRTQEVKAVPGAREELPYFYRSGPVKSDDMGFRLVLSSMNGGSIARIHEISDELERVPPEDSALASREPLKILDGLISKAAGKDRRRALSELRGSLQSYSTAVEGQQKEAVRSHLWEILYTMMSLRETNSRMISEQGRRQAAVNLIKTNDDLLKSRAEPADKKKKYAEVREASIKVRDESHQAIADGEVTYATLRSHYETLLLEVKNFPREQVLAELDSVIQSITGEDYFHRELKRCGTEVKKHVRAVLDGKSPSKIPRSEMQVASVPVAMPKPDA
jgi:formylglycine-generating enzyme required for sulfatase activity